MQEDPAFAREALRAGALGYVLKQAADDRARRRRSGWPPTADLPQPAASARGSPPQPPSPAGPPDDLTEREVEVLRLIALGHTNSEIAEQLFLERSHGRDRTARTSSRRRAGRHVPRLVRYALDHGLVESAQARRVGIDARTTVPAPGAERSSSWPSTRAIRSRHPGQPEAAALRIDVEAVDLRR